jgi:hypothetical protein
MRRGKPLLIAFIALEGLEKGTEHENTSAWMWFHVWHG